MKRFVVTLLLLAIAAPAAAQTPEEVARAEDLYTAALKEFQDGDPGRAALLFRESYDLVPKPELLYNEAVAHARAGDLFAARNVAIEALAVPLPARVHAKVHGRLAGWTLLESSRIATTPAVPAIVPTAAVEGVDPVVAKRADRAPRSAVLPIVVGSAGLVALGTAAIFEGRVAAAGRDLDAAAAAMDRAAYDDALSRGNRLQTVGRVALISGIVLVGTAAVIWLVRRTAD